MEGGRCNRWGRRDLEGSYLLIWEEGRNSHLWEEEVWILCEFWRGDSNNSEGKFIMKAWRVWKEKAWKEQKETAYLLLWRREGRHGRSCLRWKEGIGDSGGSGWRRLQGGRFYEVVGDLPFPVTFHSGVPTPPPTRFHHACILLWFYYLLMPMISIHTTLVIWFTTHARHTHTATRAFCTRCHTLLPHRERRV